MDGGTIELCAQLYDWARFGRRKGAVKLHLVLDHDAPVAPGVYNFEVSGLKVVQSWLGYRMKNPKGKKSSPLDDIGPERWTREFTTELLELLWIPEMTIAEYPRQAKLLAAVTKAQTIRV